MDIWVIPRYWIRQMRSPLRRFVAASPRPGNVDASGVCRLLRRESRHRDPNLGLLLHLRSVPLLVLDCAIYYRFYHGPDGQALRNLYFIMKDC